MRNQLNKYKKKFIIKLMYFKIIIYHKSISKTCRLVKVLIILKPCKDFILLHLNY